MSQISNMNFNTKRISFSVSSRFSMPLAICKHHKILRNVLNLIPLDIEILYWLEVNVQIISKQFLFETRIFRNVIKLIMKNIIASSMSWDDVLYDFIILSLISPQLGVSIWGSHVAFATLQIHITYVDKIYSELIFPLSFPLEVNRSKQFFLNNSISKELNLVCPNSNLLWNKWHNILFI